MSFASDLKNVSNLDEAQRLFESEVFRISRLSLYRKSKTSYNNRVLKIQNDIYDHLDKLNVKGILYFYDYMQYDNLHKTINNNVYADDSFTESDRMFFRRLWAFLAVYSLCFISFVIYVNHFVKPVPNNVSRETVKHKGNVSTSTKQTTSKKEDDNEIVYNKYRSQNTTRKVLKEDESWANR